MNCNNFKNLNNRRSIIGNLKTAGKVVIVGSGFVGASAAFAIAMSKNASEIVLIDANKDKAMGEALDINHGISFLGQMSVSDGDYSSVSGADVIVITAGTARKPGESRLDLGKRNASIVKDIVPKVMEHYTGGIILVVSNPVDVMTYLVSKLSGLPEGKVIGSGTNLDTSRFCYILSEKCKVDVRDVNAYIIGEHGDSAVPVWSLANICGQNISEFCKVCTDSCNELDKKKISQEVIECGAKVIKAKGATYYAIGLSISRIVEAILKNQSSILPVGSIMKNMYGVNDVVLSLPSIINANGIEKVLEISLNEEEIEAFRASARKVRESIDEIMD